MDQNKQKNKGRGRPYVSVSWPTTVFTVKDVAECPNNPTLTPASIRNKVRSAVEKGELTQIGKTSDSVGRPRRTYMVTTAEESQGSAL
jgi:hypothetical protein